MAAAEATGGAASPRIGPGVLDALVVGAGQAGLAAGYHLKRAGLSFEILEARGEPGGSWPGYHDSLTLFSPARYSGLPGMPFPGSPDRYPARDEVVGAGNSAAAVRPRRRAHLRGKVCPGPPRPSHQCCPSPREPQLHALWC